MRYQLQDLNGIKKTKSFLKDTIDLLKSAEPNPNYSESEDTDYFGWESSE